MSEEAPQKQDVHTTIASVDIDSRVERALVWKFDLRLLPVLAIMYLFNSLDKSNLGNAKTAGLEGMFLVLFFLDGYWSSSNFLPHRYSRSTRKPIQPHSQHLLRSLCPHGTVPWSSWKEDWTQHRTSLYDVGLWYLHRSCGWCIQLQWPFCHSVVFGYG